MTEQPNPATSWHEVAPAQVPADVHVVQHGDTLASIAERLGHPGEWLALFHHNVPEASRDKIAPDSLPVGAWLKVPGEWLQPATPAEPAVNEWAPFANEAEARAWGERRARDEHVASTEAETTAAVAHEQIPPPPPPWAGPPPPAEPPL